MGGILILVDNQVCYAWSLPGRPNEAKDVTCLKPLSGTSVTISTLRELLTLCEVEIFVCSDGWFGDDCDKQCHCLDNKEVCDKITGYCSSGCTPEFTGANCQTLCSDGWFGDNCDKRCHCLDNKEACAKMAGQCSSGCTPGFTGAICQTPPRRNDGMEILVDNQICYDWSPTERPDNITDVTCRQPLSGTSVTIRTPQEFLTLCETSTCSRYMPFMEMTFERQNQFHSQFLYN
ncbi:platelet endothelial aggregation receptor 1-like [Haliotis rubra]|uniref:platelet endothelial aggregation receptor 1-like n=1 Tax=Haliotis rubra TaxID=36100 RepID=UPI001EE58A73|nr:platelet endothelial aggregation receptor 1-like [Haliotis rubra]